MDFSAKEKKLPEKLKLRWNYLLEWMRKFNSIAVAFSSGVDSGLLCAAAWHALDGQMLALLIQSPVESPGDLESAKTLAGQIGFPIRVLPYNDLSNSIFVANPPERCYICKQGRFQLLKEIAAAEGFTQLIEGSNVDDLNDYRPGRQAIFESGVISPLQELGFTKNEIRELAKGLGLSVWNRPSAPCLATRFPYGSPITETGLEQVAAGEDYLRKLGFQIVRVRHHGNMVRIEVASEELEHLVGFRQPIMEYFKKLGFLYITIDLEGYRLGSLNEVIK